MNRQSESSSKRERTVVIAVVVVVVCLLVAIALATRDGDQVLTLERPIETPTSSNGSGDWRTETFEGVSVQVPADWAVGGSPQPDGGSAGLVDCGVGAYVDGRTDSAVPYVGRPLSMSDLCRVLDPDALPAPTASYVWFDSPAAVGAASWGNGFEAETVQLDDRRITVATDDAAVRERIVDGITYSGPTDANGCPAVQPEDTRPAGEIDGDPARLDVCVYDEAGLGGALIWSGADGADAASAFVAETDASSSTDDPAEDCASKRAFGPRVVVYVPGDSGGLAAYVVDFRCGLIRMPRTAAGVEPVAPLRPETVEPWALAGVRAYVPRPPQPVTDVEEFFHAGNG